jgi:taurine dioxygenase
MIIKKLSDYVAAEIQEIEITNLSNDQFLGIKEAWYEYSALLFRNQHLSDADLIAFSKRFGELDLPPVNENGKTFVEEYPEIYIVSNVKGADGVPIGSLGDGEATWHTDMSYLPEPPDASLLFSIEIPPSGGDTWLCGMNAAASSLPIHLRNRIANLKIKHDGTYNSGGYLRKGLSPTDDPSTSVGTPHPILCKHPVTGKTTLYLGRRRNAYVIGLELKESEALLDELWEHALREEYVFAHQWAVGDLLMWDNRSTMHRRDAFDPNTRRIMHRTQIKGSSKPIAA